MRQKSNSQSITVVEMSCEDINTAWCTKALDTMLNRASRGQLAAGEKIKTIMDRHPHLTEVRSCISVGPAAGDLDANVLGLLPKLRHYIGVEPSVEQTPYLMKTLKERCPQLDINIINMPIESWSGPEEPVDMIFASHVMYYVTQPIDVIRKMLTWLRPGGILVFNQADENSTSKIAGKFGVYEPGRCHRYRQKHLRADLQQLGAQVVFEEPYDFDMDLTKKTDSVANFYLNKEATKEECDDVFSYLDVNYPTGIEQLTSWLTGIMKPN